MMNEMNRRLIAVQVAEGYIREVQWRGLHLFNYTPQTEYGNHWTEETMQCRGLILDDQGDIVALPFRKFFNWGDAVTAAPIVEVTEKKDGSLGILFSHPAEGFRIATRGSFDSDQALWATDYFCKHYPHVETELTLLFEIIYPDNRIVVDYQGFEGLVLIGARDKRTGRDALYPELKTIAMQYGFPLPVRYGFDDIEDILQAAKALDANQEGWVVRTADGQRFKVKGDAYKLAHYLRTNLSFNRVMEAMRDNLLETMIAGVPDEFLEQVRQWQRDITERVENTRAVVRTIMRSAPPGSRKEFALWVKADYPAYAPLLFLAVDGRDLTKAIYKFAFRETIEP